MKNRNALAALAAVVMMSGATQAGQLISEHAFRYNADGNPPLDYTFVAFLFLQAGQQVYETENAVQASDSDDLASPYEARTRSTIRLPNAGGGGSARSGPTTVLEADIRTGVIAPGGVSVENSARLVVPIELTNPTAAPIMTSLTINAALTSMGTYPAVGSLAHGGAAALFDFEPTGAEFFGPGESWSESFSPVLSSPFYGLIDDTTILSPEAGRWEATGDGSVSYDILLGPGESITRWIQLVAFVGVSNLSDAGPAQYDALNDPGMFSYDVVLGDDSVSFEVVPAPGVVALVPLCGSGALRRRRRDA